jgi:hypothetical protein
LAQIISQWLSPACDANCDAVIPYYFTECGDAKMLNIILAVTIVVGAAAILYLLATVLGFPPEVAKGVAGLPALAIQNVYEWLKASSAKRALAKIGLPLALSENEFSIHPLSAFLFSIIMWSGVAPFTAMLMGMCVGAAEVVAGVEITDEKLFATLVILTTVPLRLIAAAYIGCWIGTRSRRYVLAIVIAAIALGYSAYILFSFLTMSPDDWVYKAISQRGALAHFITFLPDIVSYIISATLGFWYGQRQKPTYYLAFIMKILPQETRQTIVEMARDEAIRAGRPAMQAA